MLCILPLLLCIYAVCNVLYFILSDDDFEIKSKIYSLTHSSCFNSYLEFQDDLIFWNLFLFVFPQQFFGHFLKRFPHGHFAHKLKLNRQKCDQSLSYLFPCRLGQGLDHEHSLHDIDLNDGRELHLYETINFAYRFRFVSTREKLYFTIKFKSEMRNISDLFK